MLAKECAEKKSARKDPAFQAKENVNQRIGKQKARKNSGVLAKECADKKSAREDPAFKAKEKENQRTAKQNARKEPAVLAKECAAKQSAREDPAFKAKEIEYQLTSKQNARKDPFVQECERIKKQQSRQQKCKLKEVSGFDESNKKCKRFKDSSNDIKSYTLSDNKSFKSIEERIKQFHANIAVGPLFVCTCCHQTWFSKSVSLLKNTTSQHIVEDFTAQVLHLLIMKSGFVTLA